MRTAVGFCGFCQHFFYIPKKKKCTNVPKNNLTPSVKNRRQLRLEQMQRNMSGICTHSCIWPRNQTHSYTIPSVASAPICDWLGFNAQRFRNILGQCKRGSLKNASGVTGPGFKSHILYREGP